MKDRGIQLTDGNTAGIDLKIVVVRDSDNKIVNGLVVGDILRQNQALIVVSSPGELKFNPTIGVSIRDLLLDNDYLRIRHRIREHLAKDGMKVDSVDLSEKEPLKIEARYE